MTLKVAIQMDPMETIDIDGDSTFVLALEAQKRGHELYHYLPKHLTFCDGHVSARARRLSVERNKEKFFDLGSEETLDLRKMDVVLMRQDPPFDMSYITATHILEHIHPQTLVVNDPMHVRNAPEKLFVTHFEGVMPPTLVTADIDEVKSFRSEHKDIIVKPIYGNGGAGVFHIPPGDENLGALMELFTTTWREPVMVQRYEPDVRKGDKRIILVEGKPVGAINRVPADGEARSNMHVGGRPEKTELTAREKEICEIIGPTLAENGIIFSGIDVIGDYLTEINVTSPTGLQEVNRFDDVVLESQIWDAIEARLP